MATCRFPCQVRGFWHWVDYLCKVAVAQGREPIFFNFDETSVSQWWLQPKGCVVKKQKWRNGVPPQARVPTNRRRGAVTFGVMLPQLVLGNKHVLPLSLCAELEGVASPLLHVWRGKSGWICEETFVNYLNLVADALEPFPSIQPIILMDCASAHLGERVLDLALDRQLYVCFVPAGCTAHLQPLDVGCFGPLKAFLRRQARDALRRQGSFSKLDWLLAINKAAAEFLPGRRWAHLFHQCGVTGTRQGLKGFLASMAASFLLACQ